MNITELKIENYQTIEALHIFPDDGVIEFSGKNGAGKSAIIGATGAIWAMMKGASAHPPRPIRDGQKRSTLEMTLGGVLKVKKVFTDPDDSSKCRIEVSNISDKATYKSPAAMLKGMLGVMSLDPIKFHNMSQAEQLEVVLNMLGVKDDVIAIDAKTADLYTQRTSVNRRGKEASAILSNMPTPNGEDLERGEKSVDELLAKLDAQAKEQAQQKNLVELLEIKRSVLDDANCQHVKNDNRVVALQKEIEEIQADSKELMDLSHGVSAEIKMLSAEAEACTAPPVKETRLAITEAVALNKNHEKAKRLQSDLSRQQEIVDGLRAESAKLTRGIQGQGELKGKLFEGKKLPLDGLGIADDGLTWQGKPYGIASKGEALKVAIAISMELNPKFRVIWSEYASLLDPENLEIVRQIVDDKNKDLLPDDRYQLLLEQVDVSGKVGLYIVDGKVSVNNYK